jgi:hypothetical protein
MNDHNANEKEDDTNGGETGKVLQFRRQAAKVQPTLRRRQEFSPATQAGKGKSKNSLKGALWKSRVAKGFQLVLLITGALLALKNCGKF